MAITQEALAQRVLREAHFQKSAFNNASLWAYSDSVLDNKLLQTPANITATTPLFKIGDKSLTTADWITYAQTFRYKSDASGLKAYPQLWEEFVQAIALAYYKDHLETYNEAFRQQLDEFKDGNLFFEIMQREVWNKAQEDTAALETFYKAHAQNYTWKESADAVTFYATDAATAKLLHTQLIKAPASWKTLVNKLSEKVTADSARAELSQLPNGGKQKLAKGVITQPVLNSADSTASFALILKLYTTPAPRSFAEAKGLVVTDYQNELERNWIAELKKKYPVVVNEKALEHLTPGPSPAKL